MKKWHRMKIFSWNYYIDMKMWFIHRKPHIFIHNGLMKPHRLAYSYWKALNVLSRLYSSRLPANRSLCHICGNQMKYERRPLCAQVSVWKDWLSALIYYTAEPFYFIFFFNVPSLLSPLGEWKKGRWQTSRWPATHDMTLVTMVIAH